MAARYAYKRDGREYAPITAQEMRAIVANGGLQSQDLVRLEGTDTWMPASRLKGLFPTEDGATAAAGAIASTESTSPPPEAPAGASTGPDAAPRLDGAVRSRLSNVLLELREVGRATVGQARRLVDAGRDTIKEHRLRAAARVAQAALGECLHKAGLGEAKLRSELDKINDRLLQQATARTSTRTAADERVRLQMSLAEPYMAQAPPPGAEAEHQKALETRNALEEHLAASAVSRSALLPRDGRDRLRVAAAFTCVLALLLMAVFVMRGSHSEPQQADAPEPLGLQQGEQPGQTNPPEPPQDSESSAKQAARERMLAAQAEYEQAAAEHDAAHSQYRAARDTALAQAGYRGAAGVGPPPRIPMPDARLQLRMIEAKKVYDEAKREYEQTQ